MTAVAVCGLGQMGAAMAGRLLERGHDVVVWNRSQERAAPLVERGAAGAPSPARAASAAEVVITMLATPGAVEEVVAGPDGVAAGIGDGATLIEMSTVGPDAVRALRPRIPEAAGMLDAPVLGSVPQAAEGTLKIFVGGPDDVFERRRPLLEELGSPTRMGPLGAGASMKLVANTCLGALMTALGEALAIAAALGLRQEDVLDALAGSPIGATVKSKRANIESGEYAPNFQLYLAAKDLRLVDDAARRAGLQLRLAGAARTWLDAAEAAGLGPQDYSAVIAHILDRNAGGR